MWLVLGYEGKQSQTNNTQSEDMVNTKAMYRTQSGILYSFIQENKSCEISIPNIWFSSTFFSSDIANKV
jgi:hypothetical protein